MPLSRPSARIGVDGRDLGADEAALLRLRVDLGSDGSHDQAQVELWPRSKFADAAPGAKLTIALGERGDEQPVWAGEVSARRQAARSVTLDALAATVALNRVAKAQSYLDQTVADIVRDLAGSVAVDQVEGELKLHAYHVDNRRPVWAHLRALARLVGADLGSAADGGVRFVPAAGALTAVRLRYGAELIDWHIARRTAPQAAAVVASGAGSEQGDSRWHWLAHDPVGAGAGSTRLPGALATRDGAQTVADALAKRAGRAAVEGEVLIAGRPDLRPGGAVEVAGLPGGDPGALRIRAVRHTFDPARGFLTRLTVEGGEGGGGALGALSALGGLV